MDWYLSSSEYERANYQRLTRNAAYRLLKQVRTTRLFTRAQVGEVPDEDGGYGIFVVDTEHKRGMIYNMYHLKALCRRNGVDLKRRLKQPPPPAEPKPGFKTKSRKRKPPKMVEDISDLF